MDNEKERVIIVERPVVVMEPFSLRLWWQRRQKAKQDKIVGQEINAGIRPHGRTKGFEASTIPVRGHLGLKIFKKGDK